MTRNLQYLSTVDMDHKRCKNGPKTPQIYIVQPTSPHIVSYFVFYLALKYLQYHLMPQTCVWTVIGDQNPTYEPYEHGAQMVRKRAKNTSKLHCSSHGSARSIIFLFLTQHSNAYNTILCPNMCEDGDRCSKPYLWTIWIWSAKGAKTGQKHLKSTSFITFSCP